MQYELENLEKLLHNPNHENGDMESVEHLHESIAAEINRIKKAFVKKALNRKKDQQIEFYIQYHQDAIVRLIDDLLEFIDPSTLETNQNNDHERHVENVYTTLYYSLEQLLEYIERHFTRYFNQDAKSPESYRYLVYRELNKKIPQARYRLDKKNANKRLLSIVFNPFDDFSEGLRRKEISYRKLIYLKELLREMEELASTRYSGLKLDLQICRTLVYLNFNANRLYRFCTSEISRIVENQDALSSQIEKLAYFLKINNQVQQKPDFAYIPKALSLQQQLSEWISEELNFLEKRTLLMQNQFPSYDEPHMQVFKFRTDLSVAQIACALKILMDTGVIKNKNVLEVLRFTAGIVHSKKTENISWGSLRTKYYHPEGNAYRVIKDLAIQFMNYTNKAL